MMKPTSARTKLAHVSQVPTVCFLMNSFILSNLLFGLDEAEVNRIAQPDDARHARQDGGGDNSGFQTRFPARDHAGGRDIENRAVGEGIKLILHALTRFD